MAIWRGRLYVEMEMFEAVTQSLKKVEDKLNKLGSADARIRRLQTVPGVGPRLAETVVAFLDDPKRFQNSKHVGSYAGLTPRQYQSGQMERQGRISGQGNRLLRNLLIEVCWASLRYNPWARDTYNRLLRGSPSRKKIAITALARKLLVKCLRRKGRDNEEAKDLTQDFFHEVVLNRHLVGRADKDKGHFRSFLLYALNQYLINYDRDQRAQKRIPPEKLVSFDTPELPVLPESFSQASPEDSYQYAWLSALLERVVSDIKAGCLEQGMEIHWALFNERVLKPILEAGDPLSMAQLCEEYGIEDTKKASNMIVTVKRRFRTALIEHVRNSVASQEQTGEELEFLLQFLPGNAQRLE